MRRATGLAASAESLGPRSHWAGLSGFTASTMGGSEQRNDFLRKEKVILAALWEETAVPRALRWQLRGSARFLVWAFGDWQLLSPLGSTSHPMYSSTNPSCHARAAILRPSPWTRHVGAAVNSPLTCLTRMSPYRQPLTWQASAVLCWASGQGGGVTTWDA